MNQETESREPKPRTQRTQRTREENKVCNTANIFSVSFVFSVVESSVLKPPYLTDQSLRFSYRASAVGRGKISEELMCIVI